MYKKEENGTNYGKIIAITLAVVSGACTIIWFALKLYRKYCLLDDFYDENEDFDLDCHNSDDDCEIVYANAKEDTDENTETPDETDADAPDGEGTPIDG